MPAEAPIPASVTGMGPATPAVMREMEPINYPPGVPGPEIRGLNPYSLDNAPLTIIPSPFERPAVNFGLKMTAAHEIGHAITAFTEGVHVNYITVERSGPILGLTSLAGLVTDRVKIGKIMGAGGVDHPGVARASGFGSDKQKVEMMGLSFSDMASAANSEIHSMYTPEVIARAAELVAFLNEHTPHKYLTEK